MRTTEFNVIVKSQLARIENLLVSKGAEYNLDVKDRFSDFKQAAAFTGQTPEQVLYGYLLKHIMSITSMVQSGTEFSLDRWDEKLGDIMVYCLLLRGLVADTGRGIIEDKEHE